jgi:hypothetical protein
LMVGENGQDWYAPMLTRTRQVSDQHILFDIYFFKFKVDEKNNYVKVGIPEKASVPDGVQTRGDSDADAAPK